jgi:nucleoside-diphosphate-sugar epimerase
MPGGGLGTLPAMEVLVIGGHGKVGLRLLRLLAREGHRGRVQVSRTFGRRADVPRDDVALVLLECLEAPNPIGVEFELFEGDVPAREAVRSL